MSLSRSTLFAVLTSLSMSTVAFAQTPAASPPAAAPAAAPAATTAPAPTRVRGTLDKVDGQQIVVSTRSGDKVTLKLADNASVRWIEAIKISAIKPGSFIGTAAIAQPDGTLKALEIQVFPESMRGVGEGHRPWDKGANSSMTNGTVGDLKVSKGRLLTLTYKGGEQKVFVPANAPIITYEPATTADLKKGAHVIVTASQGADGTMTAMNVGVGKNGLTPPM
jgi:hypothetical protein